MRRLVVLALVLVGLVAVLVFTTGDAQRGEHVVAPAASAAPSAEDEAFLAEIRRREDGDTAAASAGSAV